MNNFKSRADRLLDIFLIVAMVLVVVGGIWLIALHFVAKDAAETEPPVIREPVLTEEPVLLERLSADSEPLEATVAQDTSVQVSGKDEPVLISVKPMIVQEETGGTVQVTGMEETEGKPGTEDTEDKPGTNAQVPVVIPAWLLAFWTPKEKAEPIDYAAIAEAAGWIGEAQIMSQMLCGEDPHGSKRNQAGCYWCVLNRVDDPNWSQNTIFGVITARNQFFGYSAYNPIVPEYYELALDVIGRWLCEKDGAEDVGRVLPKEYLYFTGNGLVNTFTTGDQGTGLKWDWSLPSPYEEET